jgi:hypothetical protein
MSLELQRLASAFRDAFDATDLSHAPGFLPRFPNGCCGWAAIFIGNYLREVIAESALHVMARHASQNYGHEWIEVQNGVIDITLDQFDSNLPSAYGGPALPFHEGLNVHSKDAVSDLSKFCEIRGIECVYREIVARVRGRE